MKKKTVIFDLLIEALLLFLIVFTPLAYGAVQPWSIAVFEVTAGLMLVVWILKLFLNKKFEFVSNPVILFMFFFIGYIVLQLFSFKNLPFTAYLWATKTELLKIISYSIIFIVTLNTIKRKQQITRILTVIIIMGFIMAVLFLMRFFGAAVLRGFINQDHYSGYLTMIIPLSLGQLFALTYAADKSSLTAKRFLLFFCAGVMGAGLLFTLSRGGMLSFMAALVFMTVLTCIKKSLRNKSWILVTAAVCMILVIGWLGATPVIEKVTSIKAEILSRYFGGRLPIWQGTTQMIKDYPVFGTGLGAFNYVFPKYKPVNVMWKHYTYAHSDFLELLAETGIIFFLISVFFGIYTVYYIFRRFNAGKNPRVVSMSIGFFGALTGIFIHSFAEFNLKIPAIAILLTITLSLFFSLLNYKKQLFNKDMREGEIQYTGTMPGLMKYATITGILIFTLFFIRESVKPALADYYYQKAETSKSENFILQKNLLMKSIRLDPANAAYHHSLGKLYFKKAVKFKPRTENLLSSVKYLESSIKLNPTNSKYHQTLAWTYGQLSSLRGAKYPPSLRGAKQRSNLNSDEYNKEAISEFKLAISLEPNNPYRRQVYAVWLLRHSNQENIARGVAEYRKAINLAPKLVEEVIAKYSKHKNDYKKLIAILPGTEENDYKVLKLLIKKEGLEFAIGFAQKFLKTYIHNAQIHFCIADKSFYDKNYTWEFTEKHYNIAFKNAPKNAYYRMWHGIHLCHRGRYSRAIKDLELSERLGLNSKNKTEIEKYITKCREKI